MKGIIYKWTCSKSGKSYIGQTINEERREKEFFSKSEPYTNEGSKIDNARKKYGLSKDIWKKDVLKRLWCKEGKENELLERLNYWEKYYIKEYDTFNNGYNTTDGGGYDFLVGKEVKERLRDIGKKWWQNLSNEERHVHIQKSKDWWDGLSDEERKEHINKSVSWWTYLSIEEKKSYVDKIIEKNKLWWDNLSTEEKNKHKAWLGKNLYSSVCESIRQKHLGKHHSDETKEKIRMSLFKSSSQGKKVKQFSLDGKLIKEYNSLSEASLETGVKLDSIRNSAKGLIKNPRKYIWKFSNDEDIISNKKNKGYYFHKRLNKYKSRLRYNGKEYSLGFFWNERSASEMYKYAYENRYNIDEWFKDIEIHKKYIMDKYGK